MASLYKCAGAHKEISSFAAHAPRGEQGEKNILPCSMIRKPVFFLTLYGTLGVQKGHTGVCALCVPKGNVAQEKTSEAGG